jgi:hypothetical protein
MTTYKPSYINMNQQRIMNYHERIEDPATFQWFLLGVRNPALLKVSRRVIHDRQLASVHRDHPHIRHCAAIVLSFATIAKQVHDIMKTFIQHVPQRLRWMFECLVKEPIMIVEDAHVHGHERDFICLITDRPATFPVHVIFGQSEFFCLDKDNVVIIEAIHQFAHLQVQDEACFWGMTETLEWLSDC